MRVYIMQKINTYALAEGSIESFKGNTPYGEYYLFRRLEESSQGAHQQLMATKWLKLTMAHVCCCFVALLVDFEARAMD